MRPSFSGAAQSGRVGSASLPTYVVGGGVSADYSFVSVPATLTADGVASATITITAMWQALSDGEYVPMADVAASEIVVAVSGSNNTITQPTAKTNASGVTTASFKTTTAEAKTITVRVRDRLLTQTGSCTAGGGAPPSGLFYQTAFTGSTTLSDHNSGGFVWGGLNDTAVVSFAGSNQLRFRYNVGVHAEQRFALGQDVSELWIEYDWTIPANFVHTTTPPTNNKFLQLWRDTYGSLSLTWQVGYEFELSGGVTSIRPMSSQETGELGKYVTSSGLGHPDYHKQFIGGTGPCSPGNTYQIRHHVKAASANGVANGVMEMWVNGTLFAAMYDGEFRNHTTSPIYGSEPVIRQGYLLGYANAVYGVETDFYIDNLKFYNTTPGW